MARRTALAALLGLLLLAIGHTQRAEAQGNEILQLVNAVRAEYGLAPVAYNAQLAAAAQGHANFIATQGIYSHYGVNGSTWQDRAQAAGYPGWAGENLVGGTRLTPQQGVIWWRNSAVHFSNMLNPRWTEAGVGFAVGNGQNFYVMVFGTQSEGPPPQAERVVDVPFIVAPITLAAPNPDGSIVHIVGEGHTFWAIAARYEVSIADLYLFNGLNEDTVLNPGDRLTIRLADGQPPPPTPTPPTTHTVREGSRVDHRRRLPHRSGHAAMAEWRNHRPRCLRRRSGESAPGRGGSATANAHSTTQPHRQGRRHRFRHRPAIWPVTG
jgi:hypothetical protein